MMSILWAMTMLLALHRGISSNAVIDLSSTNLSCVPRDLPPAVEFLDLSRNHIRQLLWGDFENTTCLRFLNLSRNTLEEIDPAAFCATPLLRDLDLSHNRLRNLLDQRYLFCTRNLRVLNLSFNAFVNMTLGEEFRSLATLEKLAVGANNIRVGDFRKLAGVGLQTLTLCVESGFFYVAGSLEEVQSERLQIALTKNQAIEGLHDLVHDALMLFDEFELTDLTDGYHYLTEQFLERGEMITTHLYLTRIKIIWDELTDFINRTLHSTISHLTLSDLNILKLPTKDTNVSRTSNMKSLTIRSASLNSVIFSQESVYSFFINMPIDILAIVDTPIIHMTCPNYQSPVSKLDFSNCALPDTIFCRMESPETQECKNLINLNELILRGNNLKSLQTLSKRMQYMSSLKLLDLSLNSLTYESQVECVWPANITHMNLSSNRLDHSVFECLPNGIKMLDLQNNQVSVVPKSLFHLDFLLTLNLSTNRLRDLPVCNSFPALTLLLLRENSLHAPFVSNLESCPKLEHLDVSHNPFTCTCALRGFRSLAIKSERKNDPTTIKLLNWPSAYYCSYPKTLRNLTLKNFRIPEVSCNAGLLAATILVPSVVMIIAITVLCHHLDVPWYMGMVWKWTRAKHRARTHQVRPQDIVGVEFHAFVSYSQHDVEWVKNSLLPNLQGPEGGLNICHHEKNFLAGKSIVQNIIRCVEKSWRCIFVLSAHFVKSEWCNYELYFASHQHLSRGPDSVVLVLLEPLPQYLIPTKFHQLKSMMSRYTYLEWPQDRAKHRMFWANLRAALQVDLPTPGGTRF